MASHDLYKMWKKVLFASVFKKDKSPQMTQSIHRSFPV